MNLDLLNIWENAMSFWNSLDVSFHAGIGLALFVVFFVTAMRMPQFGGEEPAPANAKSPQEDLLPMQNSNHQVP